MCETIKTALGQVEYSLRGEGKPVVFFHGGHSNCKENLFQTGWDLSKYRIITPSRPGYGNTPLNQNKTPKDTAELMSGLLGHLGIEKAIIVGISAGGLSALEFTAHFPDKSSGLILISAVTKKWLDENDDLYKKGVEMFSPKRERLSWKLFRWFFRLAPRRATKILHGQLSTVKPLDITSDEVEDIREMVFKQASGSGFVTDLNQTIETEILQKINCPTLILHSEYDKSVSIEMALHAHEKIGHAELKTYKNNWGHLLWVGTERKHPIQDLNRFLTENGC